MDLCLLAGLKPAGVLCEIMNDDGSMARRAARGICARARPQDRHDRRSHPPSAAQRALQSSACPSSGAHRVGEFRLLAYQDRVHAEVHLALVRGTLDGEGPRSCACTSPIRCAISSACAALRAPGRCARPERVRVGQRHRRHPARAGGPARSDRGAALVCRHGTGRNPRRAAPRRGGRGGAAHLRHRRADPQGPRRAAHARAVGAQADARHCRRSGLKSRDISVMRREWQRGQRGRAVSPGPQRCDGRGALQRCHRPRLLRRACAGAARGGEDRELLSRACPAPLNCRSPARGLPRAAATRRSWPRLCDPR